MPRVNYLLFEETKKEDIDGEENSKNLDRGPPVSVSSFGKDRGSAQDT